MPAHRIDLVDEDNARRILLALFKQVTNARGTHAYKHLHKVGTRNREEGNVCFTCNRSRQQRFAGSRRAHHQHPFRNASAQLLKLLWFLKKLNNLLKFFLGFFNAGDVLKRDSLLLIVE
jgi:hypothetical protein